jgi:RNA polymerase sigma-70 factor (ECF subfamily)
VDPEVRDPAEVEMLVMRPTHFTAVRRLRRAAESGDVERLESILDPDVSVVVDSGDEKNPTIRVVRGTRDAVALLVHGLSSHSGAVVERSVNGQAGLMLTRGGEPTAAITLDFTRRLVSMVWIRLHPEARRHWNMV